MALKLGQRAYGNGADTITLDSDGSGSAGDAVTFNGSGQVTPVSASDDDIIGVLTEDSPADAGDAVGVHLQGAVVANVAGSVSTGDVLEPDGTNAGRLTTNAQGSSYEVDEGGTAVYRLSMDHPRALSGAGATFKGNALGSNEAVVKLP